MSQAEINQLRQSGFDTGHAEFAERMVRALSDGLSAPDAVPRDDPFRRGWANDRATTHKLHDHAAERLRRDPADRPARWALVALALARGANDGGLSFLGPEIAADPAVVADALVISDWVAQELGFDLTRELREVCGWADRQALEGHEQTAARRHGLRCESSTEVPPPLETLATMDAVITPTGAELVSTRVVSPEGAAGAAA